MVDILTRDERSRRMALVRQKNTVPEIFVRHVLHQLGFRFRLNQTHLPGSPDIVLARWRTVVFVHGCFWHMHDCSLFKLPSTRADWWREKLKANAMRDDKIIHKLLDEHWRTVVVWQCSIKGPGRLDLGVFKHSISEAIRGKALLTELRGYK
ncbi:DNA mismatch endonuclease Vsr [Bradyrhizobium sp. CIR18]|uniref:very short patch repair endonuclease n=1 Tax=Bradyrhizobium sp. CIR18 TaxID=2663839 RepID=UPI00160576F6